MLTVVLACGSPLPAPVSGPAHLNFTIINPYTGGTPYRAQLHAHSTKSDGELKPEKVAELYRDAGYSFLALTDHNKVTSIKSVQGITLVSGVELASQNVHLTGYGVDALPRPANRTTQAVIDSINAAGGMSSLAHPASKRWKYSDGELEELAGYRFMEVYNAGTGDSEERWQFALNAGKDVFAIAVDDMHKAEAFNRAWVVVFTAGISAEQCLVALGQGNYYATSGPKVTVTVQDEVIEVNTPDPSVIAWKTSRGTAQTDSWKTASVYTIKGDEAYVRAVVERVSDRKKAWTQPVYIRSGQDN